MISLLILIGLLVRIDRFRGPDTVTVQNTREETIGVVVVGAVIAQREAIVNDTGTDGASLETDIIETGTGTEIETETVAVTVVTNIATGIASEMVTGMSEIEILTATICTVGTVAAGVRMTWMTRNHQKGFVRMMRLQPR